MRKSIAMLISAVACATAQAASALDELDGYILIEDEQGNPLYAADADGNEITFVYAEDGQAVAVIDQDGVVTNMTQPGGGGGGEQ